MVDRCQSEQAVALARLTRQNKLMAGETATRAELTAMVLTAMRAPSA